METRTGSKTATAPVYPESPQVEQSLWERVKALGPGLVYVLTIMGAGDIVSNSAAGADYGYALLWALGLTLVFRFVWVNTSAKYVLVTGETLLQGYGRLGDWILWVMLFALFILRHAYNLYLILLMGSTWDFLFHLPTEWSAAIWSVFFTFAGYVIMAQGGYTVMEQFCKVLVLLKGGSLILVAVMSNPDPGGIAHGLFVPTIPGTDGFYSAILVLMALIGTEAGSLTNLTYPYFMYEKGWRSTAYLKQQRFDLGVGVACIFIMGALLQIAAAGTVRPLGIHLEGPEHLVRIFSERLGAVGLWVFALGLWGAAFATYIGATAGYGLIFTDLCRSFVPGWKRERTGANKREETKRDPIYKWTILFWSFTPLYIIFTKASPVWLVLTVSSFVVVLIPVLAFALLKLTNDPKLMGRYKNSLFTNVVMVLLILVSLYFTYINAGKLIRDFSGLFR
jgi:Mn2+/Fe2+ NRAMP family transporter